MNNNHTTVSQPDKNTPLPPELTELIDEEVDSLRFYYLGNKYQTKVDHVGVDHGLAADQVLIL